jgi:hypothetical protein
MALSGKPPKKIIDPEALEAFLNKGGDTPTAPKVPPQVAATAKKQVEAKRPRGRPKNESPEPVIVFQLRLPSDMAETIDALISKRRFRVPRNTWILEAIQNYIEKEQGY